MKKLLLFTMVLVCLLCSPVSASNTGAVKEAIVKHSIEMGVDPAITLSIAKTESGFKQETRSSRGAVGVFQLMPSTARRMGLNPYSLDDNIKGGIIYYKSMYKMFGSTEMALAAYNAGPGAVKKYHSIPPYRETQKYVAKIMSDYKSLKKHSEVKNIIAKASSKPKQIPGKIVAQTPKKSIPLPMIKIEQNRNTTFDMLKAKPIEVGVHSQSLAI